MIVLAPISVGELVDKISILDIKIQRFTDPVKLESVQREAEQLRMTLNKLNLPVSIVDLAEELYHVNSELWDIENFKRDCEAKQTFGAEFVDAARQVYLKNDQRARIKKEINIRCGSTIVEEKSYANV